MNRATKPAPELLTLQPSGVQVDPTTGRYIASDGTRGRLTAVERVMLVVLLAHRGEIVSRERLFAATHGGALPDPSGLRAVDQAVSRLRRRLFVGVQADGPRTSGIAAVRGKGYRLTAVAPNEADGLRRGERGSSIIGRDTEIAVVEAQLAAHRRPPQRVELIGAGGIGKSSLAREILRRASERGEQATWIGLAGASDDAQVAARVASAFHIVAGYARDSAALRAAIEARMAARANGERQLVVLDDIDGCSEAIARLLAESPTLASARILVTARRKSGLPALQSHALGPLPPSEAVTLLMTRAFAEREGTLDAAELALVGEVAAALGGWPLALELAAARLREAPAGELGLHLKALAESGPRSLAALDTVLEAMWQALHPAERATLMMVAIGGGDVLAAMLDPSGIVDSALAARLAELYRAGWLGTRRGEGRVELHAIVRDFVLLQVQPADHQAFAMLLRAHAERLWKLPLSNDPRITSELASLAPQLAIASALGDRTIDPSLEDAGQASPIDPDTRALLTLALGRHYLLSGPRERTVAMADRLSALVPEVAAERQRSLHGMRSWLLVATGEGDGGAADARAGLALSSTPAERAEALTLLARTHRHMPEVAEPSLREALGLQVSPLDRAKAEAVLASFLTREERFDEALGPMMRAIETFESLAIETRYAQENYLAVILAECGISRQARRVFEGAEATYLSLGKGPMRPGFFATRALLALDAGDGAAAEKLLERVVEAADRAGRPSLAAIAAVWSIAAAMLQGHRDRALALLADVRADRPERQDRTKVLAASDRAFLHALASLLAPRREDAEVELQRARALVGGRYPATSHFIAVAAGEAPNIAESTPSGVRVRLAERLVAAVAVAGDTESLGAGAAGDTESLWATTE